MGGGEGGQDGEDDGFGEGHGDVGSVNGEGLVDAQL